MDAVVDTRAGRLRGETRDGVRRFLGIPYAAPLHGDGWFLPSEPPVPWDDVRDATEFGPTVPKPGYSEQTRKILVVEPDHPGPECLNLNVWTPVAGGGTGGGAPVYVWIHGGAFRNGSGRVPQYDGAAFARDGVVCVTINYRLGALGFLDTGDEHTNLGLRDQIAALQWVRDNIASFGGDPDRVTVGGESAGGMSVGSLLSSPLTVGLFRQAILQSGAGHHALPRVDAQKVTAELASRLGIEPTREAFARVPVERLVAEQNALDLDVQRNPDRGRWGAVATNLMLFEPVIGDDVLPALPIESIRAGAARDVTVLAGSTAEEMRFFLAPTGMLEHVTPEMLVGIGALNGLTDPAAAATYSEGAATEGDALIALTGDWFFRIPAVRLAEARGAAPTYLYELTWRSTAQGGILGACHALELPFTFDTLAAEGTEGLTGEDPPQALADAMHGAWVRFIADGDPGWPAYLPDRAVCVFDGGPEGTVESDPRGAARALWDGVR